MEINKLKFKTKTKTKIMDQLLIFTATAIPFEDLLKELQKSVNQCREVMAISHNKEDIEKAKKKVGFNCLLFMTKLNTGDDMSKAMDMAEEMDKLKDINNMFNPNKS